MKKFVFIGFLVLKNIVCFSQNQNAPKIKEHELKIATFQLVIFRRINIEYERERNDYSSYGVGAAYHEFYSSIHAFYRYYFKSSYRYGTESNFIGCFVGAHHLGFRGDMNQTIPGMGFSIGKKWMDKKRGFLVQIHLGLGQDMQKNAMVQGGIYYGIRLRERKKIY